MSSLYEETVPVAAKALKALASWLDIAQKDAEARKYDTAVLLGSRLAPDMLPFSRQVQIVCDNAKFLAARTSGKTPPKHEDTEKTFDELRTRISAVLEYLDGFKPEDFAQSDKHVVALTFAPGKGMLAGDYVRQFALPNFYFHLTTAYAILRHNGVQLGKANYLGGVDKMIDL